jgi:hypothetical protein
MRGICFLFNARAQAIRMSHYKRSAGIIVGSIEGAEDVLDPRRLVIKGSGATYVINSKIERYVASIVDPRAIGLPRGNVSFQELFMALADRANVFNNFAELGLSRRLYEPGKLFAEAARRTNKSEGDLRAIVVDIEDRIPNHTLHLETAQEYHDAIAACVEYAKKYELVTEKLFEIMSL